MDAPELGIVAILAGSAGTAVGAGAISVSGPSSAQAAGTTFTVPVQVSGMVDLYAAQFDLQFNPSTLTAVSVTQGRFLGTGGSTVFVPGAIDNTTGRITFTAITLVGPVTGVTGNGTLATITFTAKTTAATSILTLSNVVLLTSALADFAATVQNAFVGPPIPTLSDGGLLLSGLLLCALGLRMMRSPRMAQ